MKHLCKIIGIVLVIAYLSGCTSLTQKSSITINTAYRITINIQPGPYYEFSNPIPIFPKRPSSLAVWLETTDGSFIDTLFSSSNAVTGNWYNSPVDGRPEALPVWTHAAGDKRVDSISSATLKGGDTFTAGVNKSLPDGKYIVKLEINACYDYNKTWSNNLPRTDHYYSGVNGQPSVVYTATINSGSTGKILFILIGTGSVDGKDGSIHKLDGLTTALEIIKQSEVLIEN